MRRTIHVAEIFLWGVAWLSFSMIDYKFFQILIKTPEALTTDWQRTFYGIWFAFGIWFLSGEKVK